MERVYFLKIQGDRTCFFVPKEEKIIDFAPEEEKPSSKPETFELKFLDFLDDIEEKIKKQEVEAIPLEELLKDEKEVLRALKSCIDVSYSVLFDFFSYSEVNENFFGRFIYLKDKELKEGLNEEEKEELSRLREKTVEAINSLLSPKVVLVLTTEESNEDEEHPYFRFFWRDDNGYVRRKDFFEESYSDNIEQFVWFLLHNYAKRVSKIRSVEEVLGVNFHDRDLYLDKFLSSKENYKLLMRAIQLALKEEEEGILTKEEEKELENLKEEIEKAYERTVKEAKDKELQEQKEKEEKLSAYLKVLPPFLPLSFIENQYGEMIPEKEFSIFDGGMCVSYINCYSSSYLGLGTCRCESHDPTEDYEVSEGEVYKILKPHLETAVKSIREEYGDKYFKELKEIEIEKIEGIEKYPEVLQDLKDIKEAFLREYERQIEKENQMRELIETMEKAGLPTSIVLSKITNQYGEKLVADELYLNEDGAYESFINCYSSMDLGLGTCRCESHDPMKEERVSLSYFLKELSSGYFLKYLTRKEQEELLNALTEKVEFKDFPLLNIKAQDLEAVREKLKAQVEKELSKDRDRGREPEEPTI